MRNGTDRFQCEAAGTPTRFIRRPTEVGWRLPGLAPAPLAVAALVVVEARARRVPLAEVLREV